MNTNFPRTQTARPAEPDARPSPPPPALPTAPHIDWRAARLASRSCCCSARPAVIAVMPAAAGRPHQTDLLLCWHHYRASRDGLKSAGAKILNLAGSPVTSQAWAPAGTDS